MENINKNEIIKEFQRAEGDTGSPEVQIALLTARIKHITEHLKENKHDNHSRRGLLQLVGERNGLLKYLEKSNIEKYREIKQKLEIR